MTDSGPVIRRIRFSQQCEICHRIYRYKHSCFGKSHRRKALPRCAPSNLPAPVTGELLVMAPSRNLADLTRSMPPAERDLLNSKVPDNLEAFIVDYFEKRHISNPLLEDKIDSLLAASKTKCWRISGRESILDMAQHLARNCHSLRLKAKVTFRQSVVLRLAGNIKGSQRIIEDCLSGFQNNSAGPHVAALFISQASNYVYQFNFSSAHEQIKKWLPFHDIPGKQEQLLWDQISCIGRILRGQGRFMEAKRCFETCLESPGLRDTKTFLIKSNLADLYCELDYSEGPGNSFLPRAVEMVEVAIEQLRRSSRQHLRGYRRLLLSFVEAHIRQRHYREAGDGVTELLAIYGNLGEIDIVDRLGHVRTLIAFARLSVSAQDAVRRWSDVLAWNKFYNPLEEEVFTCCVAYHAISNALNALGNTTDSFEKLRRATAISRRRYRQFLIPGVGTYIYDQVLQGTAHSPEGAASIRE